MKKRWLVLVLAVALLGTGAMALKYRSRLKALAATVSESAASPREPQPLQPAEVLYDGELSRGWEDWGWGPHELGKGPAKVVFTGYGGILLHHSELPWGYGGLAFRYKSNPGWPDFLQVALRKSGVADDAFPVVAVGKEHVVPLEDGWREVLVETKQLNPERRPFDRILISSRTMVGSDWVLLDKIMLTKPSAADAAVVQDGAKGMRVTCSAAGHPISPLIYGSSSDNWSSGQTSKRMGGNPHTRLNWDIGAWNTGKDWYYENAIGKSSLFETIAERAKERRDIALVVPMIGWVSKDGTAYSFPRAKFGAQRQHDPYKPDAGDGFTADGKPIPPGPAEQTSVPAPPELIEKWVRRLVQESAARGSRGVHMYILDNEPSLWNETHRDVHPEPVTYDELLERTIRYASVIRDADPEAVIAGPAEWGWLGYLYSGLDREKGTKLQPDRLAHGGTPLVPWYLKKLAEHERTTGKRLLDVLDLHFYPAQEGVFGPNRDPATAERRVKSTRSLWDPSYRDESWINETIRLIPRMKEWVKDNYPGRKVAIGEWSFGAEDHISGGLATAEALGRFGQHGLDAAYHWGDLKEGSPTYWAFRAFRNFDGDGGRFLDLSLPVSEGKNVALFASRDASAKRLVLVLVNRDAASEIDAQVALEGCGQPTSVRLFNYGAASKALTAGNAQVASSAVSATLPAFSISVMDVRLGEPGR